MPNSELPQKENNLTSRESAFFCDDSNSIFIMGIGGDGFYEVFLDQCNSPKKLLQWVRYILYKDGITCESVREFIDIVAMQCNFDLEIP